AQGWLGALLLSCRRSYFPRVGWSLTVLLLAAMAAGSFLPLLSMSDSVYEVPIACAACCQAFACWCIYRALASDRPLGWTVLAGCGVAFALGARANYVMWAACFV